MYVCMFVCIYIFIFVYPSISSIVPHPSIHSFYCSMSFYSFHPSIPSIVPQPSNPNALVMLALLEQVAAQKDRWKRPGLTPAAFDYCMLAVSIDPKTAGALNLLAHHHLHSWLPLPHFQVQSPSVIVVPAGLGIEPADQLRGGEGEGGGLLAVTSVCDQGGEVLLTVHPPLIGPPPSSLHLRQLSRVERLCHTSLLCGGVPAAMAESHLLMGQVLQCRGHLGKALDVYRAATKACPDLLLALFHQAEILFLLGEYALALETFEKVVQRRPDDKDSNAYVMLLKALPPLCQEATLDKIREVAPGFAHEADLWLTQAKLRERRPQDHAAALKCYLAARDALVGGGRGGEVSPELLGNIGVLYHSLGRLDKAMEFCKLCLVSCSERGRGSVDGGGGGHLFQAAELENILYKWSDPLCSVILAASPADSNTPRFVLCSEEVQDLSAVVPLGVHLVIGDLLFTAAEVTTKEVECLPCPVPLPPHMAQQPMDLRIKRAMGNFTTSSVGFNFNLGRLLEDAGHSRAAAEVFIELLKRHPSFIECENTSSLLTSLYLVIDLSLPRY